LSEKQLSTVGWRLVDYERADGAWQMAADLSCYRTIENHPQPIIVRFYSFIPPAVSIGYHQTIDRVVNPQACAAAGIDVVRRPTGGRALLHRNEINYAVIADTSRATNFGSGLAEAFGVISKAIAQGLTKLGVNVEVTGRPRQRPQPVGTPGAGLCAESATRFEVTSGKSKIAAAAQLRATGKLLQHGTIYLSEEDIAPGELFVRPNRFTKPMMINLQDLLARPPQVESVLHALVTGFAEIFGSNFVTAGFSPVERHAIDNMAKSAKPPPKF